MPAKKEERGAEIDSCSLKISEEKIKILLYAWEKVYTYELYYGTGLQYSTEGA